MIFCIAKFIRPSYDSKEIKKKMLPIGLGNKWSGICRLDKT